MVRGLGQLLVCGRIMHENSLSGDNLDLYFKQWERSVAKASLADVLGGSIFAREVLVVGSNVIDRVGRTDTDGSEHHRMACVLNVKQLSSISSVAFAQKSLLRFGRLLVIAQKIKHSKVLEIRLLPPLAVHNRLFLSGCDAFLLLLAVKMEQMVLVIFQAWRLLLSKQTGEADIQIFSEMESQQALWRVQRLKVPTCFTVTLGLSAGYFRVNGTQAFQERSSTVK
ncbi:hypothetical protein Tco_0948488 [Tanacetum coccineum]